MRRVAFIAGVAASVCAACAALAGGHAHAARGDSFVLKAGRVFPVRPDMPRVLEPGVIVVRDGRIESVGDGSVIPRDLPVIEYPDASVTPGFVAAATGLPGAHNARESIGAGYWALDGFDRYADHRTILAGGVTTMHINPGNRRLLSGRGAVVRAVGPDDENGVLTPEADLTVNLRESAYGPPPLVEIPIPPSADNFIEPGQRQRPDSRIGQYIALKEGVEAALAAAGSSRSLHSEALAEAWTSGAPLRVHADRAADLLGAVAFMTTNEREGYLVGGAEAARVAARLAEAGYPLVYTAPANFRVAAGDLGPSRDAVEADLRDLSALTSLRLALAADPSSPVTDMRLAAAMALRSGLDEGRVLEAMTRVPAEILGVDDRVGSLAPGMLADLVVHSGHPLETSSHVLSVYMAGAHAFHPPFGDATVVKAGIVWLGPDDYLENGSILIEDGKISAVGRRVPRPPFARVMDAGPNGFVTPGLIDASGRLGLGGDRSAPGPELQLSRLFGAAGADAARVARAGVTTVLVTPEQVSGQGSQIAAVKTHGRDRAQRVIADTAALLFDLSDTDPAEIESRLKSRVDAGKRYAEKWAKWREEYAAWEKAIAEGEEIETEPQVEEIESASEGPDPMTGTWFTSISGGPLPEKISGNVGINLKGAEFEGKVIEPAAAEIEHTIRGNLDGTNFTGEIEIDTGGAGVPTFEGEITADDTIKGTLSFQGITLTLDAERTDREAVTFSVKRKRRTTGKDGEPLPPRIDESLEPLRAAIEGRIPLAVRVRTAAQIDSTLDYLVDKESLAVVLVNAEDARVWAERLKELGVGVVAPPRIIRQEKFREYHQASDLARHGVAVAFQSGVGDGARALPLMGLFAVERGMSADAALAAMTVDAARMFKIDDRVGSIAPGRDADLVIFSGHPFDTGSAVRRVIVGGEEVR